MFETVRADLSRYIDPSLPHQELRLSRRALIPMLTEQGCWAGLELRFRQWTGRRTTVPGLALRAVSFFSFKAIEVLTGISIARTATIGPGLYIGHFGGIVVGGDVRIGENCNLSQGVTIGVSGTGERRGSPTIGTGAYIGPGAKVFGPIVVGDDVRIGANAVVNRDVPSSATAVGVPARIIPRASEQGPPVPPLA